MPGFDASIMCCTPFWVYTRHVIFSYACIACIIVMIMRYITIDKSSSVSPVAIHLLHYHGEGSGPLLTPVGRVVLQSRTGWGFLTCYVSHAYSFLWDL